MLFELLIFALRLLFLLNDCLFSLDGGIGVLIGDSSANSPVGWGDVSIGGKIVFWIISA